MTDQGLIETDVEDNRSIYNESEDSDDESLLNVETPTDGYFTNRDHPQDTFVANAGAQAASQAKAQEAAGEHTSSIARRSSQSSAPESRTELPTPIRDAGPAPPDYAAATAHRRELSFQAQPQDDRHTRRWAPEYGSISVPPPTQLPQESGSASSFNSDHPLVRNGLFGEQGVLGRREQPESMTDTAPQPAYASVNMTGLRGGETREDDHADEETGLLRVRECRKNHRHSHGCHRHNRKQCRHGPKRRGWKRRWCCCRPMSLINALLVFGAILLLVHFCRKLDFSNSHDNDNPDIPVQDPVDPPHTPKLPTGDLLDHHRTHNCPYATNASTEHIDFDDLGTFAFLELIEASEYWAYGLHGISGTVKIAPAPSDQEPDVRVWVSIATTDPLQVKNLRYFKDDEGLELRFPDMQDEDEYSGSGGGSGTTRASSWNRACMDIAVAILVRDGLDIDRLELTTYNLDVVVESGLFMPDNETRKDEEAKGLTVWTENSISAVRGTVWAAYMDSRRTIVETSSDSIEGNYALRDLLSLKSSSGRIEVSVDPKEEDSKHPSSADFVAQSNSGSISVDFPDGFLSDIPAREYDTRVRTGSSSVSGRYILGSSSSFVTNSGSIEIDILPYSSNASSSLRTETNSAHTDVAVLSPYTTSTLESSSTSPTSDGPPPYSEVASESSISRSRASSLLDSMRSYHKSTSGSISLIYPDEWTGEISGESTSGRIKIRGKDVEMLDTHKWPARKSVTARKGDGDSRLSVKTTSGSIDILVGTN